MVLMIKTEPVQHTVKWEIKSRMREERKRKEKSQRGGRTEESKQGYKGKGTLRG